MEMISMATVDNEKGHNAVTQKGRGIGTITFRLLHVSKVNCGSRFEDCYRYADSLGRAVTFHADPSEPWLWVILEGDVALARSVIEAFVDQGLEQSQYENGFYTSVLNVNV